MTKWLRSRIAGRERVGSLNGDGTVTLWEGELFDNPRNTNEIRSFDSLELLIPCMPSKIIALWNNSKSNAQKLNLYKPEHPLFFIKASNTYLPAENKIVKPKSYDGRVIYEAELGVVIGKTCSSVKIEESKEYIFGYTCVNDVTALSIIGEEQTFPQWARAKGFDTFCPFGPVIETNLDLSKVSINAVLNGRVRQDYNVSDFFFGPEELVSLISKDVTLEPGDIISCGTGPGALPLKNGATIEIAIDGIGSLVNYYSE